MTDIRAGIRLDGDASGLVGAARQGEGALETLQTEARQTGQAGREASAGLDRMAASTARAATQSRALATAAGPARRSSRAMGTAFQQAGFQVQDFAVQVASGQNVLTAFIQQGTQLVSFFGGPWGAVVGAAGAVLGGLYLAYRETGDAVQDLADDTRSYVDLLKLSNQLTGEAAEKARLLAGIERSARIEDARAAVSAAERRVRETEAALARFEEIRAGRNARRGGTAGVEAARERRAELEAEIAESRRLVTAAEVELAALEQDVEGRAKRGADTQSDRLASTLQRLADETDAQRALAAAHGVSAEAVRDATIAQEALSTIRSLGLAVDSDQARAIVELTVALGNERVAAEAAAEAARDRARAQVEAAREHGRAVADIQRAELSLLPTHERMAQSAAAWRDETLAALDAQAEGYEALAAAVDQIYRDRLAEAREADLRSSRDWASGVRRGLADISREAGDMAAGTEAALKNLARSGEDAFVALVRGTESFSDAFGGMIDGLIEDILRLIYQAQIAQPIADFLGGIDFASMFGFGAAASGPTVTTPIGTLHGGGIAGEPRVRREAPLAAFVDAPRYHRGWPGLGPREVPAILEKDEEVLPATHPRHRLNAGRHAEPMPPPAVEIVINNNAEARVGAQARPRAGGGVNIDIFVEELDGKLAQRVTGGRSRLAPALEKTFGLSRAGGNAMR